MSDHIVTGATVATGLPGLYDAVASAIRPPNEVGIGAGTATYRFIPDLTAAQASTFTDLVATFRTHDVELTPADYAAIKPFLATGRTFLALSQSDFIALTQNARDRMLFDNVSAQWRVIFRLLRDS